jgi:DNA-binding NarL/FixJ family response regulator
MLELVFLGVMIVLVQLAVSVLVLSRIKQTDRKVRHYLEAKLQLCEQMTDQLIEALEQAKREERPEAFLGVEQTREAEGLSPRVLEVLSLEKKGLSAPEIAQQLRRPIGEVELIWRLYASSPVFAPILKD